MIPNPYGFPAIASACIFSLLVYLVLRNNRKRKANKVAAMLFFAFFLWSVAEIMQVYAPSGESNYDFALFTEHFYWIGILLTPVGAVHLSLVFPRVRKLPKYVEYGMYLPFVALVPLVFLTDWFISGMNYDNSRWIAEYGPLIPICFVYIFVFALVSVVFFIFTYVKSVIWIERSQILIIVVGVMIMNVLLTISYMVPAIIDEVSIEAPPTTSFVIIFGVFTFYSIFKYKMFVIEAVTEGETEKAMETSLTLKKGLSYIIDEAGVDESYKAFRNMVTDVPGLCITTTYPSKVRARRGLGKTPIIWLSESTSSDMTINPWRLDFEIAYTVKNFMETNKETALLIDDLEFLTSVNGYDKVMGFLKGITDTASMNNSTVILPINSKAFEEDKYNTLVGYFDEQLQAREARKEGFALIAQGGMYLVDSSKLSDSIGLLKDYVKGNPSLGIIKTFPEKFIAKYDLQGAKLFWLSEKEGGTEKCISPTRLEFELTEVIADFMGGGDGRLVMIDGLEVLIQENGFKKTLDYIKRSEDIISAKDGVLFASVVWNSLKDHEKAMLEKKFDHIIV